MFRNITFFFAPLFAFIFFNQNLLKAQTYTDRIFAFNSIPLSPQSKYFSTIQYPVNLYVGRPEIYIPFHEIPCGNLSVPIALNYNAGGVKVAEVASSVGIGWDLQAGGAITRVVRGLPDEMEYKDSDGKWRMGLFALKSYPDISTMLMDGNVLNMYANGTYDTQPDEFYYNFPGKSGKFVFDCEGNQYLIPFTKIKIKALKNEEAPTPGSDYGVIGLGAFDS